MLLSKYKVIVSEKRKYYIETLYSHYVEHFEKDNSGNVMKQESEYMFYMIIVRKIVDEYYSWLFSILFELEMRLSDKKAFLLGKVLWTSKRNNF